MGKILGRSIRTYRAYAEENLSLIEEIEVLSLEKRILKQLKF
jgi:hypothetical protein